MKTQWKKIWEWKEQSGDTIARQIRRLGSSVDWSRERFTMDEGLSNAVKEVFVKLPRRWLDLPWQTFGELGIQTTNGASTTSKLSRIEKQVHCGTSNTSLKIKTYVPMMVKITSLLRPLVLKPC